MDVPDQPELVADLGGQSFLDKLEEGGLKVVCAPDSFKESMSAQVAARAMSRGLRRTLSSCETVEIPLADGGEGLVSVLAPVLGADLVTVEVTGPKGNQVRAKYGWNDANKTAVIEVAEACGIHLAPEGERSIFTATTRGVGELLEDARMRGARRVIVGLGGSCTNDGGAGVVQTMGGSLTGPSGEPWSGDVRDLNGELTLKFPRERWQDIEVVIASDVSNPLLGSEGASTVFGPQKGAREVDVALLEAALEAWAGLLEQFVGGDIRSRPGSGAAGGLGAGLLALIGAKIEPGVQVVIEHLGVRQALEDADLLLTGEGKIDAQTSSGKAPWGLCQLAREVGVPVLAFCGVLGEGWESLVGPQGFAGVFPIGDESEKREEALTRGEQNLELAVEQVIERLLNSGTRQPSLHSGGERSKFQQDGIGLSYDS